MILLFTSSQSNANNYILVVDTVKEFKLTLVRNKLRIVQVIRSENIYFCLLMILVACEQAPVKGRKKLVSEASRQALTSFAEFLILCHSLASEFFPAHAWSLFTALTMILAELKS